MVLILIPLKDGLMVTTYPYKIAIYAKAKLK